MSSDQDKTKKDENLREFLDFYNAVQSKRYFLSDPNANPFSDTKLIKKSSSRLERLEDQKVSSSRLNALSPLSKFQAPGRIKHIQDEDSKLLVSQNNWVPEKLRIKQMEREATILQDSVESIIFLKNRTQKKLQKLTKTDFDLASTEESLRAGTKPRFQMCGCCMIKYLRVNLPFKVPNKAILDARKKWKQQYATKSSSGSEEKSTMRVTDVFSDIKQMNRKDATNLYDYTAVCAFCAQFFNNPDEYRPSYSQVVAEEKLERSILQQKQDELKWDPLALLEADRKMQQLMADVP